MRRASHSPRKDVHMCSVAKILAVCNKTHIQNLFPGINKTSVNNSRASAHKFKSLLSFYCQNAHCASILIDLINSVEISRGVKSA